MLPVSDGQKERLYKIVKQIFFSKADLDGKCGIVIAGYGDDDIFPGTYNIELLGRLKNKLITTKEENKKINLDARAYVIPFAQREMVDTIMSGIDPILGRHIKGLIGNAFSEIQKELAGNDTSDAQINQTFSRVRTELKGNIEEAQKNHYIRPVIDSVEVLPLSELGSMAEALINITSFKRRVTPVSESVGGPIDVALISKGDGLVWIKRKHYFDPGLNHQYFINQKRRPHDTCNESR